MTDDSDTQDIEERCMLGVDFGMGVSAVGRHHNDGSITVKIGDYAESVDYCPECGKPAGPIEELEELADEMDKYGSKDTDRFTAKLNSIIQDYE